MCKLTDNTTNYLETPVPFSATGNLQSCFRLLFFSQMDMMCCFFPVGLSLLIFFFKQMIWYEQVRSIFKNITEFQNCVENTVKIQSNSSHYKIYKQCQLSLFRTEWVVDKSNLTNIRSSWQESDSPNTGHINICLNPWSGFRK